MLKFCYILWYLWCVGCCCSSLSARSCTWALYDRCNGKLLVAPRTCIPLVSFVDSVLAGAVQSLVSSILQTEPCQGTEAVTAAVH